MTYVCPVCSKAKLETKRQPASFFGVSLGVFPVEVCPSCNEKFYDEATSEKINQEAKELGLWKATPHHSKS